MADEAEEISTETAPQVETPEATPGEESIMPPETPPAAEVQDAFSKGVEEARKAETAEAAPEEPEPKPEDQPAPGEPAPAEEAPKSVDAEIKDLGITNERTQKRFRELSERAAEADMLRSNAERAQQWDETVRSTGATPEQFGNALNYLAAINSGKPDAMQAAYDQMAQELKWLGQKLGKEAPGYDPLSAHPDLAEQVKAGSLDSKVAAEIVQLRQRGTLQQEQETNHQQAMQAQAEQQQAMMQVAQLGNQLRTTDPQFAQRFQALAPMVEVIQQTLPPSQWATAIHRAYLAAPATAPVAPPAKPNNPARAAPAAVSAGPTKGNEFDFGVALARSKGF